MTTKPESRLQRQIKRELKLQFPGSHWVKIHGGPYQVAGIPDLLGCVCSLYIALEVKMPGASPPSKIQEEQMRRIRKAGGWSCVVTTPEEAVDAVQSALARTKDSV